MLGALLIYVLYYFKRVLEIAILIFCIGSWFVYPGSKLFNIWRKLGFLLDPFFRPARFLMDKLGLLKIRIDFTPWVTMIFVDIVFNALVRLISTFMF